MMLDAHVPDEHLSCLSVSVSLCVCHGNLVLLLMSLCLCSTYSGFVMAAGSSQARAHVRLFLAYVNGYSQCQ